MTTIRPPSKRVTIKHYRGLGTAECEGCRQFDPDATRDDCRLHVRQTGHRVRFVVEDSTVYEPAKEGEQ